MGNKAIEFLEELYNTANSDKDGDVFFCNEFAFFKRINEMIAEIKKEDKTMKTTKIRIDFASDKQLPGLMIIKETYIDNQINWAEVIYSEDQMQSEVVIDPRAEAVLEKRLELVQPIR
jgi:hypothetical protein